MRCAEAIAHVKAGVVVTCNAVSPRFPYKSCETTVDQGSAGDHHELE